MKNLKDRGDLSIFSGENRPAPFIVVFDYSGTLSLEAVAFAEDEKLARELRFSGLADFGLALPGNLWNGIVNPTWEEGSCGPIGYRRLLVREISEAWPEDKKAASLEALDRAAGIFVTRYLSSSSIASFWQPLLRDLYEHPLAIIVAATDHYAEATAAICKHFEELQMRAVPLGQMVAEAEHLIYVANSADLGCRKDQEAFWLMIREQVGGDEPGRLILIDDFGFNEVAGDQYGQEERVAIRRQRTELLLARVFAGRHEVIPFFLVGPKNDRLERGRILSADIAAQVRNVLPWQGLGHI